MSSNTFHDDSESQPIVEEDTEMVNIEMSPRSRSKPTCHTLLSDFANMVKAFIGSNYLSIAYAFTQSGLALGIVVLFLIAAVTDHCCHLIVKCKYRCIRHVVQRHRRHHHNTRNMVNSSRQNVAISDDSDSEDEDEDFKEELGEIRKQMTQNFTYGDVGRICFGSVGLFVVNMCLLFTQFGFCVAYFIFIGNTLYSLFPFFNTTIRSGGGNMSAFGDDLFPVLSVADSLPLVSGAQGISPSDNSSLVSTLADLVSNVSTSLSPLLPLANTTFSPVFTSSSNDTPTTAIPDEVTAQMNNFSSNIFKSDAPDLSYLVVTPLPIFIGFAFLRDIRHLGFVSVGANISIFIGCIVTICYLFIDFTASDTWVMFDFMKVAVFFGMATSSFEGIGTIIPIECSMEGNRHNFGKFLHGAVGILFAILVLFGVVGYLRYGDATEQMLNKNIPTDTPVGMAISVCLCIGVLLTFPLQIYPVIEISEIYMFGKGGLCGPKKNRDDEDDEREDRQTGDTDALLPKDEVEMPLAVATKISDEVSTWKRNILRIFLVVAAAGLAVLMRDLYAYVSAFIGAIGSSLLAYVLPCLFHLKLGWRDLGLGIKIKNIIIISFGFLASIVSMYTTIQEVITKV